MRCSLKYIACYNIFYPHLEACGKDWELLEPKQNRKLKTTFFFLIAQQCDTRITPITSEIGETINFHCIPFRKLQLRPMGISGRPIRHNNMLSRENAAKIFFPFTSLFPESHYPSKIRFTLHHSLLSLFWISPWRGWHIIKAFWAGCLRAVPCLLSCQLIGMRTQYFNITACPVVTDDNGLVLWVLFFFFFDM